MMQPLIIQATNSTPSVHFDFENRKFEIAGFSTSSVAINFYESVQRWQKEFHNEMKVKRASIESPRYSLIFDFKIEEMNAYSEQCFLHIISWIELLAKMGHLSLVRWTLNKDNKKLKEYIASLIPKFESFFEVVDEKGLSSLFRQPTDVTPKVFFDSPSGVFRLSGMSRPEFIDTIYAPIEEWLDRHAANVMNGAALDIKMRYFNTPSAKAIMHLLQKVAKNCQGKTPVRVNWYYEDEDEKEEGSELARVTKMSFNFVQRENKDDKTNSQKSL